MPRISLNATGYSFSSINSDTANNIINGKVVKSINGLKDNITLMGSGGTTITSTGDTISVSSTGTGGTGIQGVQNTNNTIDIINPNGPTATANLKVPLTLSGIINYPNYLISAISTGTGSGILGVGQSGIGLVGIAQANTGVNYGVAGNTNSPSGFAVSGWNLATTGDAVGVIGKTSSPTGRGVLGQSTSGAGIEGIITSDGGIAIYGNTPNGSHSWAGFFEGYVNVSATLYVGDLLVTGSKNFQIDHPLDPENKFLVHSSIESPDRMNIYNGNITTDAGGLATVNLPSYFEALNIDYRYQLTVIGQFAQVIVEKEIQNNSFVIRTDKPNVKVSWQVSGIRNDAYAKANPMVVEKEKNVKEKGKYYYPELYGQPKSKGQFNITDVKPEKVN